MIFLETAGLPDPSLMSKDEKVTLCQSVFLGAVVAASQLLAPEKDLCQGRFPNTPYKT